MNFMTLENEGFITCGGITDYWREAAINRILTAKSIRVVTDVEGQFTKAHASDAGYDIVAKIAGAVMPHSSLLVSTGLKVGLPNDYVGIMKSRSGLSVKHGIDVGAGVIDCGYTGEVKVLLRNTSDKWFHFNMGDRIAQMLVVPLGAFTITHTDSLEKTDRGSDGFGSTGGHDGG